MYVQKTPKYVASGKYGCVYVPPIRCNTPCVDERCIKGVSKWMNTDAAENEVAEYERLKLEEIDPDSKYYISQPYQCEPHHEDILNIAPCAVIKDNKNTRLLIYQNGGIDLHRYMVSKVPLSDVLYGLQNIFQGVMIMNENDRYHLDIKPTNIVIDEHGTYRLIDFGLARKIPKQKFNDIYAPVYAVTYLVWSPEMIFVGHHPQGNLNKDKTERINPPNFRLKDHQYWQIIAEKYRRDKYANPLIEWLYIRKKWTTDMRAEILEKVAKLPYKDQVLVSIEKADVYGLGMLLMTIGMLYYTNRAILRRDVSRATGMPYWVNPITDITSYRLPIDGGDVHTMLMNFIIESNMVHPDPSLRPTPREAFDKYSEFIASSNIVKK
jgi:serine/threonine protein kinase